MNNEKTGPDELESRQFTALNAPVGGGPEPEEKTPGISNEQIIAGAIASGREVFCTFTGMQSPRRTLGDEQAKELGAVWAPLLEKHGINLSEIIGDYALEAAAIFSTVTIALAVRKAAIAEMNAMDAARNQAPQAETQEAEIVG